MHLYFDLCNLLNKFSNLFIFLSADERSKQLVFRFCSQGVQLDPTVELASVKPLLVIGRSFASFPVRVPESHVTCASPRLGAGGGGKRCE